MTLNLVPTERSCERYTHVKYESCKSYQSKDMANVKVFGDKQTDAQTNRLAKNYMPLSIDVLALKKNEKKNE